MIQSGDITQLCAWADHRFLTSNMYVTACELLTIDKNVVLMWCFFFIIVYLIFWIGKGHDSPETPPPLHPTQPQITIRTPLLGPATEVFPEP